MSSNFPIFNRINRDPSLKPASFGARERFEQEILVGTSRKNSHELATITVERHVDADGRATFTLYIDGEPVKRGTLDGKRYTPLRVGSE